MPNGLLIGLVRFACLALLEDETCKLFELLVERANDTQVGLLLDVILQETGKHRELFRHLSKVFENGAVADPPGCGREMGEFFVNSLALLHSVKDEVVRGMPAVEAAKRLISFEEGAGEEYLTEMHAKLGSLLEKDLAVKTILEGIAEDEKGHAGLLKLVIQISSER